jgi:hypothetical protein
MSRAERRDHDAVQRFRVVTTATTGAIRAMSCLSIYITESRVWWFLPRQVPDRATPSNARTLIGDPIPVAVERAPIARAGDLSGSPAPASRSLDGFLVCSAAR